jgi:hypothetical protein
MRCFSTYLSSPSKRIQLTHMIDVNGGEPMPHRAPMNQQKQSIL